MHATALYKGEATLGEGALWDRRIEKLWWVDIVDGNVHRFDPRTHTNETFHIGQRVSTVVPEEGGDVLVTVKNGFARYSTASQTLEMLQVIEHLHEDVRFNDGKCDPWGRFLAGTMTEDGVRTIGKLYRLNNDSSVDVLLEGIGISNGIGWSPSGDTLYYIDTVTQRVVAFTYDGTTGAISDQRVVAEVASEEGAPDGMCVDADGMLWIALWGGGKVICLDPVSGERHAEVMVPGASLVTSCSFGGENLDTLFITTASVGLSREERDAQQNAGDLFVCKTETKGLPANVFKHS